MAKKNVRKKKPKATSIIRRKQRTTKKSNSKLVLSSFKIPKLNDLIKKPIEDDEIIALTETEPLPMISQTPEELANELIAMVRSGNYTYLSAALSLADKYNVDQSYIGKVLANFRPIVEKIRQEAEDLNLMTKDTTPLPDMD